MIMLEVFFYFFFLLLQNRKFGGAGLCKVNKCLWKLFLPTFLVPTKNSSKAYSHSQTEACINVSYAPARQDVFFFPDPTVEQRIMGKISVSGCYLATLSRREWQTRMLALSGPRQLEQAISQAGPNEEAGIKGVEMGRQRLIPSLVRAQWEGAYMAKPGD